MFAENKSSGDIYRGPILRQTEDGSGNFEEVMLCDVPGRTIWTEEAGKPVEKTIIIQKYVPVSDGESH